MRHNIKAARLGISRRSVIGVAAGVAALGLLTAAPTTATASTAAPATVRAAAPAGGAGVGVGVRR